MNCKKVSGWLLLMFVGTLLLGSGGAIQLKAWAAQWMLEEAWQNTLAQHPSTQVHKPWPWADTWPVAKLKWGSDNAMIVLDGVTGNALAFGPGKVRDAGMPERHGVVVMAGHRDTHFSSLKTLSLGDEVSVQSPDGHWQTYRVSDITIVNTETHMIDMSAADQAPAQLMLVTCYPFDAVQAGGPLRYVVTATESV